jgi:hypothetical protein
MNKMLIALAVIGTLVVGSISILGMAVSEFNGASQLRNQYEMKVSANSASYDNMWKKIKQVSNIPEQKKVAFQEILVNYADARTGDSKQLMTWVQESVPNLDLGIYDQIVNIITGSRDSWTMSQLELVSVAEQYNQKLSVFPGNFILPMMGFSKINPKVIISTKTQEVFASGLDDDI